MSGKIFPNNVWRDSLHGMVCAARLSARSGRAPAADTERLVSLLRRLGLPTDTPGHLDRHALLDAMRLDKKNRSGALRLILWNGIGAARIVDGVGDGDVLKAFDA